MVGRPNQALGAVRRGSCFRGQSRVASINGATTDKPRPPTDRFILIRSVGSLVWKTRLELRGDVPGRQQRIGHQTELGGAYAAIIGDDSSTRHLQKKWPDYAGDQTFFAVSVEACSGRKSSELAPTAMLFKRRKLGRRQNPVCEQTQRSCVRYCSLGHAGRCPGAGLPSRYKHRPVKARSSTPRQPKPSLASCWTTSSSEPARLVPARSALPP